MCQHPSSYITLTWSRAHMFQKWTPKTWFIKNFNWSLIVILSGRLSTLPFSWLVNGLNADFRTAWCVVIIHLGKYVRFKRAEFWHCIADSGLWFNRDGPNHVLNTSPCVLRIRLSNGILMNKCEKTFRNRIANTSGFAFRRRNSVI